MTHTIEEIIGKYIELRDRKAALAKKQDEEMQTITEPMQHIENYLMHQMNQLGVNQLKGATGTAFKTTSTSVQLKEPAEFKAFVFEPAIKAIVNHLNVSGMPVNNLMAETISHIVRDMTRWDVVDFRAGKKGIQEYLENTQQAVPGVAVNSVATVNVRRA